MKPLREPTYFILATLVDERRHGYAIIKLAEELSNGRVRLSAGTLYGALDRLALEELIVIDGEEIVDSRVRRYYTLTEKGRSALTAESERLAEAAAIVSRRLKKTSPPTTSSSSTKGRKK